MNTLRKTTITAIATAFVLVSLSACTTTTPYQAASESQRYGFSDQKLEQNRFRIKFSGNSETSRDTVEDYMLYHAAELTLAQGYDWFIVADRHTKEDKRETLTLESGFSSRFGFRSYRAGVWGPWGSMAVADRDEFNRYEAVAEITLGKGKKPDNDPNAYDARDLKANLDSHIKRAQDKK